MTLADVLTELATRGALKPSRVPAMKTSLGYLAKALGHASPDACYADVALSQEATWGKALEAHWGTLETPERTISAYTKRNVRNDIRKVFKLAETHGLLKTPLPERLLTKPKRTDFERSQPATGPYQATYRLQSGTRHYGLPPAQWPPDIQEGWRDYRAQCGLRLRETSFRFYAKALSCYLGYQAHVVGRTPTWEDLFDVAQLRAFVLWHGARMERHITVQGRSVVLMSAAMANVLGHKQARALADFRNTLPTPPPLHNKRQHHWVPLATLEAVADACLAEGRAPYIANARVQHPGAQRATQFQKGVILKLLVRVPLRQRNVRELRLRDHLYKDQEGSWRLSLRGRDLKIGTRQGRVNEYKLNLTEFFPDFIPVLEEFLDVHRPRLPGAAASPLCFLTQSGRPFSVKSLGQELSMAVHMRTGTRWFPHMIRTTWATECLEKTQDFQTAATMLGDTLAVVMKTYYDVVNKDQHAKAAAFLSTALHTG